MNENNLFPEDPTTWDAMMLLENLWLSQWLEINRAPLIENRTIFQWYEGALGHLCHTGSIRLTEIGEYDA